MTASTILWVYVALLVLGGLFGHLKAKSKISLILSVVFGALISLCALGIVFQEYMSDVFLAALMVVFSVRLAKTKKFMPSGLLLTITAVAFVLHLVLARTVG